MGQAHGEQLADALRVAFVADVMAVHAAGPAAFFLTAEQAFHFLFTLEVFERLLADEAFVGVVGGHGSPSLMGFCRMILHPEGEIVKCFPKRTGAPVWHFQCK